MIKTIWKVFYVDDCLKSVQKTEDTTQLIEELRQLLAKRPFRLTKFVCNDVEVLSLIPESERVHPLLAELPVERAIGVEWNVREDAFNFWTTERKKTPTHQGILSDVSSMYDPLGFATPFILPAKRILQQLCKDKIRWDEDISLSMLQAWEWWLNDLPCLQNISVLRYFKSWKLGQLTSVQLHHFCDASFDCYGIVSYLRFEDVDGEVHFGDGQITSIADKANYNSEVGTHCGDGNS